MTQISIFNRITEISPSQKKSIDHFLEDIQNNPEYEKITYLVRAGKKDKKEAPNVTISGVFSARKDSDLVAHSGFICIDIDNTDPNEVKAILAPSEYVYAIFESIRGNGAAVIFKINGDKHRESFINLSKWLYETYDLVADQSCINVSRARFISYDPNIYINRSAKKWTRTAIDKPKQEYKERIVYVKSDFDEIINNIAQNRINICEDYNDWIRIGFALCDKFGESGRSYFHILSQISDKYNEAQCDKKYDALLKGRGHGVTIGTLYHMAKSAGLSIYSERTKKVIEVTKYGKKIGQTKDQIKDSLKIEGIEDSDQAVDQVYDNDQSIKIGDTLIDQIAQELKSYNIRRNEVTRFLELRNEKIISQTDLNTIFLSLKKDYEKLTYEIFERIILSDYTSKYNPFKEWFSKQKNYKKSGYIDELFSCIQTDTGDENYLKYFGKKWLVGVVSGWFGYPSPLVLVLCGVKQGTGKSRFFRDLLPSELSGYKNGRIVENAFHFFYGESKLDQGRDDEIMMTQKGLINDDEFGGKSKKDFTRFKELTSKVLFSLREPYGKVNVDLKRVAGLCGTSNDDSVLYDPTGNRRIIPINVLSIDHERLNKIDRINVWMEAKQLLDDGFEWEILGDDIEYLNRPLQNFEAPSLEFELLTKYFRKPQLINGGEFYTTSDIKAYIENKSNQRLSLTKLGMEIKGRLRAEKVSKRIDGVPRSGYLLEEKFFEIEESDKFNW